MQGGKYKGGMPGSSSTNFILFLSVQEQGEYRHHGVLLSPGDRQH